MAREDVDLVVEVIGGIEPARSLIMAALRRGASVVTANKALLAEDGATLFAEAERAGADLYFEASVAGAIPIIRPLRESLVGDEITSVMGIVNGTTNFILDKMDSDGAGFAEALAEAHELGYAEADPTADVEGFDAAAKAAILASLAFHSRVLAADVYREGITDVTSSRHRVSLARLGASSSCWPSANSPRPATTSTGRSRWVHPAMIPRTHPGQRQRRLQRGLRRIPVGRSADVLRPGCGGSPTASAVLGTTVARNRVRGAVGPGESSYAARPVVSIGRVVTRYHISLQVADVAGVLATIAQCFARHDVSIQTVRQDGHGADASWLS